MIKKRSRSWETGSHSAVSWIEAPTKERVSRDNFLYKKAGDFFQPWDLRRKRSA